MCTESIVDIYLLCPHLHISIVEECLIKKKNVPPPGIKNS